MNETSWPWLTRCATCFPPPTEDNPFLDDYAATVMPSEQEAMKVADLHMLDGARDHTIWVWRRGWKLLNA